MEGIFKQFSFEFSRDDVEDMRGVDCIDDTVLPNHCSRTTSPFWLSSKRCQTPRKKVGLTLNVSPEIFNAY